MSRTVRNTNGEVVRQSKERKRKDKKFFGFTDGQHSRQRYDRINGENVKTDRAPVVGKDFIKYSWPSEGRHKDVLINKIQIEEAEAEIKEFENK